jgi:hypothetical protein
MFFLQLIGLYMLGSQSRTLAQALVHTNLPSSCRFFCDIEGESQLWIYKGLLKLTNASFEGVYSKFKCSPVIYRW